MRLDSWLQKFERPIWIVLFALALGVRMVAAVERSATATLRGMVDSRIYLQLARDVGQGQWWPADGLYMSPLYPFLLALFPGGSESGVPLVLLVQAVGGSLALLALAWVARREGGVIAGVATLLLGALAAPLVVYDASLLSDAPAFSCLALAMAALAWRPHDRRVVLAAGLLAALAYGYRANLLLPPLAWGVWMLLRERAWRRVLLLWAPLAAVMLLLAVVNQRASGHFTPRSFNAGQNLYIGNNPDADGGYTHLNEIGPSDMAGRAAAERRAGRPLDAQEVEQFWRSQTLDFVRDHPGQALGLAARKLLLVFHPFEFPQMEALSLVRTESRALRWSFVGLAWVLPLSILGLWSLQRETWLRWMPLWTTLAGSILICVVFFVNARLRLPIWAGLLPLAGMGVAALSRGLAGRARRRTLLRFALGLIVTLAISLYPSHAAYRNALSAARYAVLEALAGHRDAARAWMQREREFEQQGLRLGETPPLEVTLARHPDARWLLAMERGAAWYVLGDLQRAYDEMVGAADALPRHRRAQEGLAQIAQDLLRQGLGDASVRAAQRRALERLGEL